jgi:hypothetical protein
MKKNKPSKFAILVRITSLSFICLVFLSSCFSYHVKTDRLAQKEFSTIEKEQAFIINQSEYPQECRIIKKSKLYAFTDDSTTNLKIRLTKLSYLPTFRCLTGPAVFMFITLGQVPIKLPESYQFEYEEIQNSETKKVNYPININKRIWFWDILSWQKTPNRAISLSLRQERAKLNKRY